MQNANNIIWRFVTTLFMISSLSHIAVAQDKPAVNPALDAAIHDYIMRHPQVIREALEKAALDEQQQFSFCELHRGIHGRLEVWSTLWVVSAAPALQRRLLGQERRALREEHRECGRSKVTHRIHRVVALPPVRQGREQRLQRDDERIKVKMRTAGR